MWKTSNGIQMHLQGGTERVKVKWKAPAALLY
jgi:hypothetical protein